MRMNAGTFRVVTTFFAFYILAAPISGVIALSDRFTTFITLENRRKNKAKKVLDGFQLF